MIYGNTFGSVLMFRYRSNTLGLKWNNRFSGGAMDCLLCGAVEETVEHFVVECGGLRETREVRSQRGCRF